MKNAVQTAPLVVRAAQFALTLQIAFDLVALAFLTAAVASTFAAGPALLLPPPARRWFDR